MLLQGCVAEVCFFSLPWKTGWFKTITVLRFSSMFAGFGSHSGSEVEGNVVSIVVCITAV